MSARVGLFFLLGVALIWVTFETLERKQDQPQQGLHARRLAWPLAAHCDVEEE